MIKENTAVFIGHGECHELTGESVERAIAALIEKGVTTFLSGGQGGFDRLCARCVHKLRRRYPEIQSYLIIPYLNFNIFDQSLFDEIIYPDGLENLHYKAAIPARNRYMLDHADHAVCFIRHSWGGAAKTYEWAKKKKLQIVDIAPPSPLSTPENP